MLLLKERLDRYSNTFYIFDNVIFNFFLQVKPESSLIDPVLLQQETLTKITLFIVDSSISSKLFFLKIQKGSSFIDPVLLQEET